MELFMVRRCSAWADQAELEKAAEKSSRIGNEEMPDKVRWIRSYVINEADGRRLRANRRNGGGPPGSDLKSSEAGSRSLCLALRRKVHKEEDA